MPTDKSIDNSSKKPLDDANTLHEQLKKLKEDEKNIAEDSSKPSKTLDDIDNPVHDYCS